jgi:hypothetical protein
MSGNDSQDRNRDRERAIAERARQLFAGSVQGLDGRTRSQLAQARAKAVAVAGSRGLPWWATPSRLVPLGAVAAAALAVAVIWQSPESALGLAEPTVLGDIDILLEGESFDLFEELEFYAWLLEQPELSEGGEAGDESG